MGDICFRVMGVDGVGQLEIEVQNLLVIGYAGRNIEKTMEHVLELEKQLGIPAPKRIPTIFQCGEQMLTQKEEIQVIGEKTSGEVEYVIIKHGHKLFITIGSDHTDRELEAISISKAKQICPKPIGKEIWIYEDIQDHFDKIEVRSWQLCGEEEVLYQKGKLSDILPVEIILKEIEQRIGELENAIIFSGTVPLYNSFLYSNCFRCSLWDPVLKRELSLQYQISSISEQAR